MTGEKPYLSVGRELKKILVRLKDDSEALPDLMSLMNDRLYSEAMSFLKDPTEAEAAVNWAFFRLWEKASQYTEDRAALPYVISVLRNYCRDLWRSSSRKPQCTSIDSVDLHTATANYTEDLVIDMVLDQKEARLAKRVYLGRSSLTELKREGEDVGLARKAICKLRAALASDK